MTTQADDKPLSCRACGYDLSGLPLSADGKRTCPDCGLASRIITPRRRRIEELPSCRCEHCGYELAGIARGLNPIVRCPECGRAFNMTWASRLEPWPGDRAALKKMLAFTPTGLVVFVLAAVLIWTATRGTAKPPLYLLGLGFALVLAAGEALVQAHRLTVTCFGKREYWETMPRVAAIGVGATLGIWLPVAGVVVLMAVL